MIILGIVNSFELSECVIFLAVVDESVCVAWAKNFFTFETSQHRWSCVFFEETSKINGVDDPILIALGANEFGVA